MAARGKKESFALHEYTYIRIAVDELSKTKLSNEKSTAVRLLKHQLDQACKGQTVSFKPGEYRLMCTAIQAKISTDEKHQAPIRPSRSRGVPKLTSKVPQILKEAPDPSTREWEGEQSHPYEEDGHFGPAQIAPPRYVTSGDEPPPYPYEDEDHFGPAQIAPPPHHYDEEGHIDPAQVVPPRYVTSGDEPPPYPYEDEAPAHPEKENANFGSGKKADGLDDGPLNPAWAGAIEFSGKEHDQPKKRGPDEPFRHDWYD
jgi:hypothetical protein